MIGPQVFRIQVLGRQSLAAVCTFSCHSQLQLNHPLSLPEGGEGVSPWLAYQNRRNKVRRSISTGLKPAMLHVALISSPWPSLTYQVVISGLPPLASDPKLKRLAAVLSDHCQAFDVGACTNLRRVLCGSIVGCARTHAAHPVMRHLDRQCALNFAQIVTLGRAGKGRSYPLC
jgi:hypothetical protein